MRLINVSAAVVMAAITLTAAAQPTVTVTLDSSKDGRIVRPGATVDWTIRLSVSAGDNQGLALISCDLVQDGDNPTKLDIPPADESSIDAKMLNFDRPDGVSNSGEGAEATGYVGVQRGGAGAKDLVQIGGGQNTFGEALPPGSDVGESATVIAGVGQGGTPQIVASGSFRAPTKNDAYVFRLENVIANVLAEVNPPPDSSPVVSAAVDTSDASIRFTVRRWQVEPAGPVQEREAVPVP